MKIEKQQKEMMKKQRKKKENIHILSQILMKYI